MGNYQNILIQSSVSSTSQTSQIPWSKQFTLLDKQPLNKTFILHHMPTNQPYKIKHLVLNKMQHTDIFRQIDIKKNTPSPFVLQLDKVQSYTVKGYCSQHQEVFLMYKYIESNLKEEILNRRFRQQRFSEEQIKTVIEAGVKGISYLNEIGNTPKGLNSSQILITSSRAILINDPWVSIGSKINTDHVNKQKQSSFAKDSQQLSSSSFPTPVQQYPSPQKILYQNQLIDEYNEWLSELFTFGIIILQMIFMQPLQDLLYQKSQKKIYYHKVKEKIEEIVQNVHLSIDVSKEGMKKDDEKSLVGRLNFNINIQRNSGSLLGQIKEDLRRLLSHEPRIRQSVYLKYKKNKSEYMFLKKARQDFMKQNNKISPANNQTNPNTFLNDPPFSSRSINNFNNLNPQTYNYNEIPRSNYLTMPHTSSESINQQNNLNNYGYGDNLLPNLQQFDKTMLNNYSKRIQHFSISNQINGQNLESNKNNSKFRVVSSTVPRKSQNKIEIEKSKDFGQNNNFISGDINKWQPAYHILGRGNKNQQNTQIKRSLAMFNTQSTNHQNPTNISNSYLNKFQTSNNFRSTNKLNDNIQRKGFIQIETKNHHLKRDASLPVVKMHQPSLYRDNLVSIDKKRNGQLSPKKQTLIQKQKDNFYTKSNHNQDFKPLNITSFQSTYNSKPLFTIPQQNAYLTTNNQIQPNSYINSNNYNYKPSNQTQSFNTTYQKSIPTSFGSSFSYRPTVPSYYNPPILTNPSNQPTNTFYSGKGFQNSTNPQVDQNLYHTKQQNNNLSQNTSQIVPLKDINGCCYLDSLNTSNNARFDFLKRDQQNAGFGNIKDSSLDNTLGLYLDKQKYQSFTLGRVGSINNLTNNTQTYSKISLSSSTQQLNQPTQLPSYLSKYQIPSSISNMNKNLSSYSNSYTKGYPFSYMPSNLNNYQYKQVKSINYGDDSHFLNDKQSFVIESYGSGPFGTTKLMTNNVNAYQSRAQTPISNLATINNHSNHSDPVNMNNSVPNPNQNISPKTSFDINQSMISNIRGEGKSFSSMDEQMIELKKFGQQRSLQNMSTILQKKNSSNNFSGSSEKQSTVIDRINELQRNGETTGMYNRNSFEKSLQSGYKSASNNYGNFNNRGSSESLNRNSSYQKLNSGTYHNQISNLPQPRTNSSQNYLQTPQRYPAKGRLNSTIREASCQDSGMNQSINNSVNNANNLTNNNQSFSSERITQGLSIQPQNTEVSKYGQQKNKIQLFSANQNNNNALINGYYGKQNISSMNSKNNSNIKIQNDNSSHVVYEDGSKYIGDVNEDGNSDGYGILYYPDGNIAYQGTWSNGDFDGKGHLFNPYHEDMPGSYDYNNLQNMDEYMKEFEGNFSYDKKQGKGIMKLHNEQIYSGQFKNDFADGRGKYYSSDGSVIDGLWQAGLLQNIY